MNGPAAWCTNTAGRQPAGRSSTRRCHSGSTSRVTASWAMQPTAACVWSRASLSVRPKECRRSAGLSPGIAPSPVGESATWRLSAPWCRRWSKPAIMRWCRSGPSPSGIRRRWVAEAEGVPAGYTVLSPVPARNGWLVEQIVRGRTAPNGTAESLLAAAASAVAAESSSFITLGAAPLSRRGPRLTGAHPRWLRIVTAWMRAHGTRFYNFRGLEHFKAKFRPQAWEPVYAVADASRIRPATLYAVLGAFTGSSPLLALAKAIGRGLATEIKRLRGSRR